MNTAAKSPSQPAAFGKASSIFFSRLEFNLALSMLGIWITYALVLLAFRPPYWALMDDHAYIGQLATFDRLGLWGWMMHFVKGDFGWGMFRPVYGAYIYLFYGFFGNGSPLAAYLTIFATNVLIFCLWGCSFARLTVGDHEDRRSRGMWTALFVVLCFHFIRNNNLFFFASIQERAVILFVGAALYLYSIRKQTALAAACLVLAVLSKAVAVSFLPVFALLSIARGSGMGRREDRGRQWIWAGLLLALTAGGLAFYASIRTGYTAGYDWSAVGERIRTDGKFHKIFNFSVLTILLATFGWLKRDRRDFETLSASLIWPLGMLAYTAIMLPWQGFLNYYLIIPVGMFWVGAKLVVFRECVFWLNKWKRLPYTLAFIAVIAVTSINPMRKFYFKAIHHHGTGKAVAFLNERIRAGGADRLDIRTAEGCEETASAIGNFLDRPGFTSLARKDDSFYKTPANPGTVKLVITHGECPNIPDTFSPSAAAFRYGDWAIYERGDQISVV